MIPSILTSSSSMFVLRRKINRKCGVVGKGYKAVWLVILI